MNLVSLPHPNKFLVVEQLDYPNPYDFKIAHRHDYFELILIKKGGGKQQIDLKTTTLTSNNVYVIYPRQIHLLERDNESEGVIIQFRKEIFDFLLPLQHHYLYFPNPDLELTDEIFSNLYNLTQNILLLNNKENLSSLSIHKSYSYLKILLITLIELFQEKAVENSDHFASKFLQLVSQNIKEKRKVTDYAEMMNMSTEKLTFLCKESFGNTPLKIIHEELILEIKRSILLGNQSLKEIAFDLNFENTSNFSSFVKTATNLSPSELQEQLNQKF